MTRTTVLMLVLALAGLGCSSDDDCDAAASCARKNDALITSGKIVPICGAPTKNDGTTYSWTTDQGTCTCTLDQRLAGSFWRGCRFR